MYAQEIDFGCVEDFLSNSEFHGDGGDEGDEFSGCAGSDADVPFFGPAWRHQSPVIIRHAPPKETAPYHFKNETE